MLLADASPVIEPSGALPTANRTVNPSEADAGRSLVRAKVHTEPEPVTLQPAGLAGAAVADTGKVTLILTSLAR
jgi:hypothetical protein